MSKRILFFTLCIAAVTAWLVFDKGEKLPEPPAAVSVAARENTEDDLRQLEEAIDQTVANQKHQSLTENELASLASKVRNHPYPWMDPKAEYYLRVIPPDPHVPYKMLVIGRPEPPPGLDDYELRKQLLLEQLKKYHSPIPSTAPAGLNRKSIAE